LGAFFCRPVDGKKTGLSAPTPRPLRGLRGFRFNPLRGPRAGNNFVKQNYDQPPCAARGLGQGTEGCGGNGSFLRGAQKMRSNMALLLTKRLSLEYRINLREARTDRGAQGIGGGAKRARRAGAIAQPRKARFFAAFHAAKNALCMEKINSGKFGQINIYY
jgi:hypothetical protein